MPLLSTRRFGILVELRPDGLFTLPEQCRTPSSTTRMQFLRLSNETFKGLISFGTVSVAKPTPFEASILWGHLSEMPT
jgi:hypothetical protein